MGKGKLCELAREHAAVEKQTESLALPDESNAPYDHVFNNPLSDTSQSHSEMASAQLAAAMEQLHQKIHQRRISTTRKDSPNARGYSVSVGPNSDTFLRKLVAISSMKSKSWGVQSK
jgi:trehalose/maltose hydrolase-like predicted phosphorylase